MEQTEEEEEMPAAEEVSSQAPPSGSEVTGRRSQFRVVRESIQNLQIEVGRYRKSHEASSKKLEAQVASLRKELSTLVRPKDLGAHFKGHESDTKRLERQIATLRAELVTLKSQFAKEAAKSRAKEEAALSRLVAKAKAVRPAKAKTKRSKKR